MKQLLKKTLSVCSFIANRKVLPHLEYGNVRNRGDVIPVFIIGAPRSGSTYLSQLMIGSTDIGFYTNFHDELYGAPFLAEKLMSLMSVSNRNTSYSSEFGYSKGLFSESEGGRFWRRFFSKENEHSKLVGMQRERLIVALDMLFKASKSKRFLIKNNFNSFRLETLSEAFPHAKYIYLKRDVADNAVSLYAARKKIYGDENVWWSMKPKDNVGLDDLEPYQQVVEQVLRINSQIEHDLDRYIEAENVICVEYSTLERERDNIINDIASFIGRDSIDLNIPEYNTCIKRNGTEFPDTRQSIERYLNERC